MKSWGLPECFAESSLVLAGDVVPAQFMVLATAMGDLDGTHEGSQTTGFFQIPTLLQAVEQAGAVGIAAAGGIGQFRWLDAGNVDAATFGIDLGAFAAEGDDQGFYILGQGFQTAAGAFRDEFCFIVIHRGVFGQLQELEQFLAVEHGQALTGIEDEGDAGFLELAGVLHHAVATVGGNDAEGHALGIGHLVQMGVAHGARVEGGDLVVVQIGSDEGLGGKGAGDFADMRRIEAQLVQAVQIGLRIVADGSHDQGVAAEELEVVGDIAGAASEFATQIGYEESYVEDVNLVGQDVVLELVMENHDVVVGHGAADQGAHRGLS